MLFYPKMIYLLANNQGKTKENHNNNVYGISKNNQKVTRLKKENKNNKSQKKNKLKKANI